MKNTYKVVQSNKARHACKRTIVCKTLIDRSQKWIDRHGQTPDYGWCHQQVRQRKKSSATPTCPYSCMGCRNLRGSYIHRDPLLTSAVSSMPTRASCHEPSTVLSIQHRPKTPGAKPPGAHRLYLPLHRLVHRLLSLAGSCIQICLIVQILVDRLLKCI